MDDVASAVLSNGSGSRNSQNIEFTSSEDAAQAKEAEADRHLAAHDLDAALNCLNKAIFLRPDHAMLYAKRAQVYSELCDLKSAMANYRKLFSIYPAPPQRIKDHFAALLDLHAYSLLMLQESPSIVIAYLTEAIQLNAVEETYWLHRALAYIEANCFDKALRDIDHCICLDTKDVEYFILRAKLHWRLHMHDRATSDIQRATILMPDHPEVIAHEQRLLKESQLIFEEACKHLVVRQYKEAITSLTKAAEISPEETRFYLLRASAYRELGEYHVALKDTDKAMSCHRSKIETAQRKQQAHTDGSQDPRRLQQTTLDVDKDTSKEYREIMTQRNLILNDIALRFLREKSFQLALNAMNQTIRGDLRISELFHEHLPNPQYYVNRGDAYQGLNNFQAALADYHHALELLPESQEVKSRVAFIHYQFGIELFNKALFDKAELEFSHAIAHNPTVAAYFIRKGDAARFLEKHSIACADYQQALRLNPFDNTTKDKLGQYSIPAPASSAETVINQHIETQKSPHFSSRETRSPFAKQLPSQAKQQSRVEDARKAYERKNKLVKDLFLNRPVVLPPSSTIAKKPA